MGSTLSSNLQAQVSSLYSNCIHFCRVSNQYSNIRAYSHALWYHVANDCMFTKVLQRIQASNIAPREDPRPLDIVPQTRIRPYPPLTLELIGAFNCFAVSSFPRFVTRYHSVFGIITIFVFVARLIILSELESDLSLFDHTWAATCGSYTTDNLYVVSR